MPNQPLLQLAKRSARDVTFMAHLIDKQATREKVSWEQLAELLDLSTAQLTRLALCKRPREDFYTQDTAQIVGYSGINRVVLMHLMDSAQKGAPLKQRTYRPAASGSIQRKEKERKLFMLSRRTWAIALTALLALIFGAFVLAQPGGTEATLVVSEGEVTVNQAGGAIFAGAANTAVSAGEVVTVREGDTIRVNDNASAQLRLQDGSTVDLFGGSTMSVTELVATDTSFRVQLNLLTGKTLSRVVRLLGADDAFEIKTPSSTASVRGTIFTVETLSPDRTHVVVEEGTVRVALGDAFVDVQAGFQVTAVVGQALQLQPNSEPTASPTNTPEPAEEPSEATTDAPTETPTAVPAEDEDDLENGAPPTRVPGDTPDDVPGEGDPPTGGATPPGQTDPEDDGEVDTTDSTESEKVIICHVPAGDASKAVTIEIDRADLPEHLAHGDSEGACPEPDADNSDADSSSGDSDDSPGNSGNTPANDGDGSPGNSGDNNGGGNSGGGNSGGGNSGGGNGGGKP